MSLLRSSAVFQRLKQDQDPIAWHLYWRARGVENYMRRGHVVRSKAIAQYLAALRSWGHAYVYDEADLTAKLQGAGFGAIVRVQPGVSEHPQLKDIEQRTSYENTAGVMILEATAV